MSHWAENVCDDCQRPIHPNQGAFCGTCTDERVLTDWVAAGLPADQFAPEDHETPDDVFADRSDQQVRRFPEGWWDRGSGGGAA